MERGSTFEDLQRLARGLDRLDARTARRQVVRLGATALPLLLRELGASQPARAELARELVFELTSTEAELRPRAVRGLLALAETSCDRTKTAALGLLRELGVTSAAPAFTDPEAVKRRSAAALAQQLDSDADVAAAAELMTRRLDAEELVTLLELMAEDAPPAAARLAHELCGRMDLDGAVRSEVRRIAASRILPAESKLDRARARDEGATEPGPTDDAQAGATAIGAGRARRPSRVTPALVSILADDQGRHVVVALRRDGGLRRWRRLAVSIGVDGVLHECLYDDDVPASELGRPEAAPLVRGLLDDGYRAISEDPARARALTATAAQRAAAVPQRLTSAYYLGRDILDLADLHLGPRPGGGEVEMLIGRAVDLFAAGDLARAHQLAAACARLAPGNADVASTLGLCFLAAGELTAAAEWLARAAAIEPAWPMHHWNLASVHHRAECAPACALALAAFLQASERAVAVLEDTAHAERIALARRYVAAHLPLAKPASRRRTGRRPSRRQTPAAPRPE